MNIHKLVILMLLSIFTFGCGGGGGGGDTDTQTPPIDPAPIQVGPGNPIYDNFYCPDPKADKTIVTYESFGSMAFKVAYPHNYLLEKKCHWTMKKITRGGNSIDTIEYFSPQLRNDKNLNCYSPQNSIKLFFDLTNHTLIMMNFELGWCGIINNRIRIGVTSMWDLLSYAPFFDADDGNSVSYTKPGYWKVYAFYNSTTGKIIKASIKSSGY